LMAKSQAQLLTGSDRALDWAREVVIVVGASLFVALCARVSVPLPFTPVPLTLSNFAVLLVGLTLGRSRGFAALALYLAEGASGLPVFSPTGPGGIAQLLGPSGGFLMAYPFVAGLAGWIAERGRAGLAQVSFARFAVASLLGEMLLFAAGISWLFVLTHSFAQALRFGLYWFVFAEVIKVLLAAGAASGWRKIRQ
jgi:biotin transport system substrate-specific component